MSEQGALPLIDEGLQEHAHTRRGDPVTSNLAAARVVVTEAQKIVMAILRMYGPMTDERLVERVHAIWSAKKISDQSIRSRRAELVRKGMVQATGDYALNERGNRCQLWAVTDGA